MTLTLLFIQSLEALTSSAHSRLSSELNWEIATLHYTLHAPLKLKPTETNMKQKTHYKEAEI